MKEAATQFRTVNTVIHSIRRAFILLIVCIFIPGCMGSAETSGNNTTNLNGRLFIAVNTITSATNFHNMGTDAINGSNVSVTSMIADESGSAGTDKNQSAPTNLSNPIQAIDTDHHLDPHNGNEEEKIINITLPALMRIAILALLIIIIV